MLSLRTQLVALLFAPSFALRNVPQVCLWAPPRVIRAGNNLTAQIYNASGKRCEAELAFDDPDFFPVRFHFDAIECPGMQIAEFTVPAEVPMGDAFVTWHCAGQDSSTCVQINIPDGTGTLNIREAAGVNHCVVEARQTSIVTRSTVSAGQPVLETTTTVLTVPSTLLPSPFTTINAQADATPTGDGTVPLTPSTQASATVTSATSSATNRLAPVAPSNARGPALPPLPLPPRTTTTSEMGEPTSGTGSTTVLDERTVTLKATPVASLTETVERSMQSDEKGSAAASSRDTGVGRTATMEDAVQRQQPVTEAIGGITFTSIASPLGNIAATALAATTITVLVTSVVSSCAQETRV